MHQLRPSTRQFPINRDAAPHAVCSWRKDIKAARKELCKEMRAHKDELKEALRDLTREMRWLFGILIALLLVTLVAVLQLPSG